MRCGIAVRISDSFYELPVSNMSVGNRVLPWGGGGYFRLTPISLFLRGVRSILDKEGAYLFYLHPWEIDPEQPKVKEAPLFARFRHYVNLEKNYSRLERFLLDFSDCTLNTCREYLKVSEGL